MLDRFRIEIGRSCSLCDCFVGRRVDPLSRRYDWLRRDCSVFNVGDLGRLCDAGDRSLVCDSGDCIR